MFKSIALSSSLALLGMLGSVAAAGLRPSQMKNLVTFGDSYTDVVNPGDGTVSWPTYAAMYGSFNLFPFAHAGASCSKTLTPLPFESLDPYLFETQLPLFYLENANGSLRDVAHEETMYTLWIGTNDVGANALLTGQAMPGVTVADTVNCAFDFIKTLYQSGARNFLFQNMVPLQKTILYSADSYPNRYWNAPRNTTMWNVVMAELVGATNQIASLLLPTLPSLLPGIRIGLFDSHRLFEDILAKPGLYLNGTVPPNITGAIKSCVFQTNQNTSETGNCTIVTGPAADSYMWFDELHPSQQVERVVAREVTAAVHRTSNKYTTWFS